MDKYAMWGEADEYYPAHRLSVSVIAYAFGLILSLAMQAVSADSDGLNDALERCDGIHIPGLLPGTCNSAAVCDAHRACVQANGQACECTSAASCTVLPTTDPGDGKFCDPSTDSTCTIACAETTDFDCDNINDQVEFEGGAPSDPTDPADPGPAPPDTDGDGVANGGPTSCDLDDDNDGVPDTVDTFDVDPNTCADADGDFCDDCAIGTDGFGPLADNDPANDGPDHEGDGQCNLGDPDDDNDGVADTADACELGDTSWTSNASTDNDGDGCRDAGAEDSDDDNDGIPDVADACPAGETGWTPGPTTDNDSDGCRDATEDTDDDNDGVADGSDNCSLLPNPSQAESGGDPALGDACDPDMDGDGIANTADACPLDVSLTPGSGNGFDDNCARICWREHVGVPVPGDPAAPDVTDGDIFGDQGWSGAHKVVIDNGTDQPHVSFMALKEKSADVFYMAFEVQNDSNGLNADDLVVVTIRPSVNFSGGSFEPGNQNGDLRIIIEPDSNSRTVAKYNSGWSNIAASGITSGVSSSAGAWNIEFRMPTDTWAGIGTDFKFFFSVLRNDGSTTTQFVWPEHDDHMVFGELTEYDYPGHEWGAATRDNAAQCNGVFLTTTDIGTTNTPSSSINLNSPNTFFANVSNLGWNSGSWQPADNVRVRFRIADWGMAVGDETADSWREIPGSAPTPGCTTSDRNPSCSATVPAATAADAPGMQPYNLDWTVSAADKPKYDPVQGGYKHQCMLVEIEADSGVNIVTRSARRNMNFDETASVFERKARIDTRGLGRPDDGDRHRIIIRDQVQESAAFRLGDNKAFMKRNPEADPHAMVSKTRWLLHGYEQTGLYVEYRERRYPITTSFASFGYEISHTGASAVADWNYDIVGDDVETGKEGDGSYSEVRIAENGSREIVTRAEPVERFVLGAKLDTRSLMLLLLLLLILLAAWWLWLLRSRA